MKYEFKALLQGRHVYSVSLSVNEKREALMKIHNAMARANFDEYVTGNGVLDAPTLKAFEIFYVDRPAYWKEDRVKKVFAEMQKDAGVTSDREVLPATIKLILQTINYGRNN
jgi:hypothetical protein